MEKIEFKFDKIIIKENATQMEVGPKFHEKRIIYIKKHFNINDGNIFRIFVWFKKKKKNIADNNSLKYRCNKIWKNFEPQHKFDIDDQLFS